VVRADGVIPSRYEMDWLFRNKAIERIDPSIRLPGNPWYFGSIISFCNIGQYNEARTFARNGGIINGIYYFLEN
jgi:hypothetical protein